MTTLANFPGLLEAFFTDRLMRQRQASPHTIASYRDTFRLLLEFVSLRLKKAPSAFLLDDLDAPLIGAFLDHLERERGISARSRNVRLAAIHSFFKYAAFHQPAHSALIQRVLAMPSKRYDKSAIEFLSRSEIDALVAAADQQTWIGRRDRALLLLAVQSGLRVSELVGLRCQDVVLGNGAHVRCQGKGRKERCTPLRKETVTLLRAWLREQNGPPANPLFPNVRGGQLSRDAVEDLLAKHVRTASPALPFVETEARLATRASSHGGDGSPPARRGSFGDRSLARPRIRRDHADVSPRQLAAEGGSARQDCPLERPSGPLPPRRPPVGLPEEPLIMPGHAASDPPILGQSAIPPSIIRDPA